MQHIDRRELLKLVGLGGVASHYRVSPWPRPQERSRQRLLLPPALRHPLGLQGSPNPEADRTLKKAVGA